MQGYNPAPAPQGSAQQHANVAQHLAMNIPGFGNPAGIKFRGAVHATTAFSAPQHSQTGGGAPAAYATPAYAAPAYAAPAYGAPVYGATATLAAVPSTYASGGAPVRSRERVFSPPSASQAAHCLLSRSRQASLLGSRRSQRRWPPWYRPLHPATPEARRRSVPRPPRPRRTHRKPATPLAQPQQHLPWKHQPTSPAPSRKRS